MNHMPFDYLPILLQFLVAAAFVVVVLVATHLLGPKSSGVRHDNSFEYGLDSVGTHGRSILKNWGGLDLRKS